MSRRTNLERYLNRLVFIETQSGMTCCGTVVHVDNIFLRLEEAQMLVHIDTIVRIWIDEPVS